MSFTHQRQISGIRGLKTAEAFVLYRLAEYADKDGVCFPGEQLLAHECRVVERTIRYILANLEDLGLIKRVEEGHTAPGKRKKYQLTFENALLVGINREEKAPARPLKGPKKGPRKTRFEPTDEPEPQLPVVYRGGEPEPVATPDVPHIEIDVEALRERRRNILAVISRVERKERYAVEYWEKYGAARMEELETINRIIGLDVEMEVSVG